MIFDCKTVWSWLKAANTPKADITTKAGKKELLNKMKLVQEEMVELMSAINLGDEEEAMDGVIDLLWTVNNVAYSLDPIKLMDYRDAVDDSNWSKFCKTLEEAERSKDFYEQGTHFAKFGTKIEVTIEKVSNNCYILRSPEGKVLKSHKYVDAKILYDKIVKNKSVNS